MSVTCSSHNLSELENVRVELQKDAFALQQLKGFDFRFDEILPFTDYKPEDFNLWLGLLMDRIELLDQHVHDLTAWEGSLRQGSEFNSPTE